MTRAQQIGVVLGLAIVTALTILRASDPGIFKLIRGVTFDEYQRLVPRTFEPMPVRVIDIDETSLHEFGQWPWPRDRMALLVDRLSEMGASAIAFDILFAEPDRLSPRNVIREVAGVDPSLAAKLPDNDEIFARAIAEKPVVLGFGLSNEGNYRPPVKAGFAFTGESPVSAPLSRCFDAVAAAVGSQCGGARSYQPQSRQSLAGGTGGPTVPDRRRAALSESRDRSAACRTGGIDLRAIRRTRSRLSIMTSVKIGDFVVPLTAAGELWLYVTPDRAERYISARQVLAAEGASPDVAAAVAEQHRLRRDIGGLRLQDIRVTALGENVPGVSLHAQAVEQILSGRFLSRPDWADGLEILMIAVLGCLLVGVTTFVSPAVALACGLLITAMALVASWLSFLYAGLLLDPLAPIISGSITHFASTSFRILVIDRERREVRRAFGHYLSPSLLHRIEHSRDALRLGGDDRELTVMFVDVRSFTEISERLAPTAVVAFLNTLLDALSRHVVANEGTLDKFIGDSIMAFWNAPVDVADHEIKAVRAALAMRETLAELNAGDAFGFGPGQQVGIGIGIHTGLACVGNMGAKTRFNYSAVGDAVNVAARLESCCKEVGFDILISDSTARSVQGMALIEA